MGFAVDASFGETNANLLQMFNARTSERALRNPTLSTHNANTRTPIKPAHIRTLTSQTDGAREKRIADEGTAAERLPLFAWSSFWKMFEKTGK